MSQDIIVYGAVKLIDGGYALEMDRLHNAAAPVVSQYQGGGSGNPTSIQSIIASPNDIARIGLYQIMVELVWQNEARMGRQM